MIAFFPLLSPGAPHFPTESELPPMHTIATALTRPDLWRPLFDALYAAFRPIAGDLLPPLALSALFFSSTLFTESISASKYPKAYAAYQRRVGMFAPVDTLCKLATSYVFDSNQTRKETRRLVWGPVHAADKEE